MKSFKGLLKSFVYAFRGIAFAIGNERNMRIHLCFCVYMFSFLLVFDFFEVSRTQLALLAVACGAVMSAEIINTAVERAVDLACKEHNELAKIAKDCAAGAVLVAAIFAIICGISILWQPEAFSAMFDYYKTHPAMLAALIISLTVSLIFIFSGKVGNIKKISIRKHKND